MIWEGSIMFTGKYMWNAEVYEKLRCVRKVGNDSDTLAVTGEKEAVIVGHIPQNIIDMFHHCMMR